MLGRLAGQQRPRAEPAYGHARRQSATIRKPSDKRRYGRGVSHSQADAADHPEDAIEENQRMHAAGEASAKQADAEKNRGKSERSTRANALAQTRSERRRQPPAKRWRWRTPR